MYKKAVRILKATVGIKSSHYRHLPQIPFPLEVKSLQTDFKDVVEVPWDEGCFDGRISIEDNSGLTHISRDKDSIIVQGPLSEMADSASDLRFSLWGNLGLLYRFVLTLLEKKHEIYNLHACALFEKERNRLYVIMGGAGSGKTVYLLSGLEKDLSLFSTETVHFMLHGADVSWFKGSLVDNVRLGNLMYNFPRFLPEGSLHATDQAWQKKIALDLSGYQTAGDILVNPDIFLILPRIEEGRKGFIADTFSDPKKSAKAIFDNISSKIAESFILYDRIPLPGFEDENLCRRRLEVVSSLASHISLRNMMSVLSNPYECWGNILDIN